MSRAVSAAALSAVLGLSAGPVAQVLVLSDDPAARVVPVSAPATVAVTATVLRHRPANQTSVPKEKLVVCRTLPELAQVLRTAGPLEVLCRSGREVACVPSARAEFLTTETRPAFLLQGNGSTPTNQVFGLDLHADVRVLLPATATTPPVLSLSWEGSWSGSVSLLERWEAVAVRGFNVVRKVPGITYEKLEEDEDGFVNTGGGSDFSGLFKRKRKDKAADKKTSSPLAVAAAAANAPREHEPSYSAETAVETVPLHGHWLGTGGQLLITRVPLSVGKNPGDFYLVLEVRSAD